MLIGCALAFLLALGGVVSCSAFNTLTDALETRTSGVHLYDYDDGYGSDAPYGYDDGYGSPLPYGYGDGSDSGDALISGLTLDDIASAAGTLPNEVANGRCSAGVYRVGADIEPGRYFLGGSAQAEGGFVLFTPDGDGTYALDVSVTYFGNYFADLQAGDVIAFLTDGASMEPVADASFAPAAPYDCGLYRVGTDVPAGTYELTASTTAALSGTASAPLAAYVMSDLDFDEDSITDMVSIEAGETQTITVSEGEWLELYGVVATPAS